MSEGFRAKGIIKGKREKGQNFLGIYKISLPIIIIIIVYT